MANKSKIHEKLKKELDELKTRFDTGHELNLVYLPNEKRISDNGKELSGEIQNSNIMIYQSDMKSAIETLTHEFLEYIINDMTKEYVNIINKQNETISRLLYLLREGAVNKLSNGIK